MCRLWRAELLAFHRYVYFVFCALYYLCKRQACSLLFLKEGSEGLTLGLWSIRSGSYSFYHYWFCDSALPNCWPDDLLSMSCLGSQTIVKAAHGHVYYFNPNKITMILIAGDFWLGSWDPCWQRIMWRGTPSSWVHVQDNLTMLLDFLASSHLWCK